MATVDESVSITEAAKIMREKRTGCVIVLKQGTPIGILTDSDVAWKAVGCELNPQNIKVGEIMSTPLITIDPDADLVEAAKVMDQKKIRRLAVGRKGILYGTLRAVDIARNLEGYVENQIRSILKYAFSPIHS